MKARFLLVPVAAFALLASGCGGGGGEKATQVGDEDIATVGSLHVTKQRFLDTLARYRAGLVAEKKKFPKEGTTEYEQIKAQAIWALVLEAARQQEADKDGIKVTEEEISARIDTLKKGPPFNGNQKKFAAELKKEGYTEAELRNRYADVIRSEQLSARINGDVKVSDDAIHDYFEEHKAEYLPSRDIQYILVGKDKKATAADLKAQRQDPNKDKAAAKKVAAAFDDPEKTARQVYAQLRKGAKFAALAKKYSQDESTKNAGGKLTATKGQVVPEFWKNVEAMKTNAVAQPFETPEFGWFVVKALKPVHTPTEKDAADGIRQQLLTEKSNEAYIDWSQKLAANVCKSGRIEYQIGYTPDPQVDPCASYRAAATAPTGG